MKKDRDYNIAERLGILPQIEELEHQLLAIDGVTEIEFDLNNLLDNLNEIIFLARYDIDVRLDNYFAVRRTMVHKILEVAEANELVKTEDVIEDYGAHLYFVFSFRRGSRWAAKEAE